MDNLLRDFRHAVRNLRQDCGFSLVAILTLALGIGATTAGFSVFDCVFYRGLPYKDFDRLVVVNRLAFDAAGLSKDQPYFSPGEIRAFREQNHFLSDLVPYTWARPTYNDGSSVRYFPTGTLVGANAFEVLGVQPFMGRTLSAEDGESDSPAVFVVNYEFWKRDFGGDPMVLGKTFILDGKPTTLVGVMPQGFNLFATGKWFNPAGENFWRPIRPDQLTSSSFRLLVRLKSGASIEAAGEDLNKIAHRMHEPSSNGFFPEETFPQNDFAIVPRRLLDSMIGDFKKTIYAFMAAVLLLHLIACSNVANLLLARATTRDREMAMRAVLGAGHPHLVRQLMMESLLLGGVSVSAGCFLAYWGLRALAILIPAGALPEATLIRINGLVLALALSLTLITIMTCGLAPVLRAVRGDLRSRLKNAGENTGASLNQRRFRAGLVVAEVAVSIILLIGAALLTRSFFQLTKVDFGFDPRNVAYFFLNLPPSYNTDVPGSLERKNVLTRQLLDRLNALPGAVSAAEFADVPPLEYEVSDTIVMGKPHATPSETRFELCSEGYFRTLSLPLIRGRLFSQADMAAGRMVMVINEAFSRTYFPEEDPLGRKVKLAYLDSGFLAAPHNAYFEIIGIVRDYKTRSYDNPSWQDFPGAFIPYSVAGYNWRGFMVRSVGNPAILLREARREFQGIDPAIQIGISGTLEGTLREFYARARFEFVTLAAVGAIGLILMVIGIFSVLSYTVSLQTREVGVRMALGAQKANIMRRVLVEGLQVVVAGTLVGFAASAALTRLLVSEMPGVSPPDPWTYAVVAAAVLATALAASLLPALKATRVEPIVAIRHE